LTKAEEQFYAQMKELEELALFAPNLPCVEEVNEVGFVGAGIGGGFEQTGELNVMKYKEAMASPDKAKWEQGVEAEHEKMVTYEVFQPVDVNEIPKDAKILTSTWAMKKKADVTYRARLTASGYEQIDGLHFDSSDPSASVVNDNTIRIVFVLMIMA
jgi:aspartyl/asparaginyl-tRNA synthetase